MGMLRSWTRMFLRSRLSGRGEKKKDRATERDRERERVKRLYRFGASVARCNSEAPPNNSGRDYDQRGASARARSFKELSGSGSEFYGELRLSARARGRALRISNGFSPSPPTRLGERREAWRGSEKGAKWSRGNVICPANGSARGAGRGGAVFAAAPRGRNRTRARRQRNAREASLTRGNNDVTHSPPEDLNARGPLAGSGGRGGRGRGNIGFARFGDAFHDRICG